MKPRSDSKLKNLPEEMQEAIIAWARTPKSERCVGGLAYAREQLAADGIRVSMRALSEFVAWWELRERFSSASQRAQQIEELIREKNPSFTPEKVREIGQAMFTLEALAQQDTRAYVALESLQLSREIAETRAKQEARKIEIAQEKLRQADRRIKILEENQARAKATLEGIKSKGGLTPETLKQIEEASRLL